MNYADVKPAPPDGKRQADSDRSSTSDMSNNCNGFDGAPVAVQNGVSGPRPSLAPALLPGSSSNESNNTEDDENNTIQDSRSVGGSTWTPNSQKAADAQLNGKSYLDHNRHHTPPLAPALSSSTPSPRPKRLRDLKTVGANRMDKLNGRQNSHQKDGNGLASYDSLGGNTMTDSKFDNGMSHNASANSLLRSRNSPILSPLARPGLDIQTPKAMSPSAVNATNSDIELRPQDELREITVTRQGSEKRVGVRFSKGSGNSEVVSQENRQVNAETSGPGLGDSSQPQEGACEVQPNGQHLEADTENNSNEAQDVAVRPQHARARRTSRSRRSAVFMEPNEGLHSNDQPFDIFHNQTFHSSFHTARKKEIARTRWIKAIWFATEEAHRRRAEKKLKSSLESTSKRKGSFVPLEKRLSISLLESESKRNLALARSPTDGGVSKAARSDKPLKSDRKTCWQRTSEILVFLSLIYLLFGFEFYIIFSEEVPRSSDIANYSIIAACFFFLAIDIIQGGLCNSGYRGKIYMWLGIVMIASIIPDLVILGLLVSVPDSSNKGSSDVTKMLYLSRLWRLLAMVARAGTRGSRSLRVLHLVDTIAGSKYGRKQKSSSSNAVHDSGAGNHHSDNGATNAGNEDAEEWSDQTYKQKMGKKSIGHELDHCISHHYILFAGLILFSSLGISVLMPSDKMEETQTYLQLLTLASQSCDQIEYDFTCSDTLVQSFIQRIELSGQHLLYLQLSGRAVFGNDTRRNCFREFPYPETIAASFGGNETESIIHILDRKHVISLCWMNVAESATLIIFLLIVSTSLSSLVRMQVVIPLQRIVRTVLALEADPLRPLRRKNEQALGRKLHEVKLIENALHKIASLMQLGFGEAGANIIKENMKLGDTVEVNSDVPGKVVHAIYGFCDIRNFTDCTEVLQGDVVKLVNEVAYLVHEAVVDNLGAPNKNIGDAFLLVWKPKGAHSITEVAESALRSYVRTIIEISRCKKLDRWANKSEIQQRLPGFQVKMGFGMHYGWAIEGAIGSLHKIDASYLSPHVNMASRLEAATKQFGVFILFSEDVHALLGPSIQNLCRKVDRVTLKGSTKPMRLYTYDVPLIASRGGPLDDNIDLSKSVSLPDFFNRVPPSTDEGFRNLWTFAMDLYLGGPGGNNANWRSARQILETLRGQVPADGPTRTLLAVMERLQLPDGSAPKDWKGYRTLDEK